MTEQDKPASEKEAWDRVKDMLGEGEMRLGAHWSYNLQNDPKRLAFVLSRYKFAAKMGSTGKDVLELGSSEGIGAPLLWEFARSYKGVDSDAPAIETARKNWVREGVTFQTDDFLGKRYGDFDTVVSMDVVEHIMPESEELYFQTVAMNLRPDGMAIIGTPNVTSEAYASAASRAGHVNLFDARRLRSTMQRYFHTVFSFGMNDEVLHTGFPAMAHFLLCVGCGVKKEHHHA